MRTLQDLKQELSKNPRFVDEYEALEPEYQIARQLIALRLKRGLSQAELAKRAGTKQASVSRVETGATVPTLPLLKRLAKALGARLEIRLVPDEKMFSTRESPSTSSLSPVEASSRVQV